MGALDGYGVFLGLLSPSSCLPLPLVATMSSPRACGTCPRPLRPIGPCRRRPLVLQQPGDVVMGPTLAGRARIALRLQLPGQVPDAKVRTIEPPEGEPYRVDLHLIGARQKMDPVPGLPDVLAGLEPADKVPVIIEQSHGPSRRLPARRCGPRPWRWQFGPVASWPTFRPGSHCWPSG